MPEYGEIQYYIGVYEEGTYPGFTDTGGKRYYNSYCFEHHVAEEPEPEIDPETGEPVKDDEEVSGQGDEKTPEKTDNPAETGKPAKPAS